MKSEIASMRTSSNDRVLNAANFMYENMMNAENIAPTTEVHSTILYNSSTSAGVMVRFEDIYDFSFETLVRVFGSAFTHHISQTSSSY